MFNAVTAFLGVLVFFQRSTSWRLLAAAMFAITLPYFFLAGARSHFLAAVLPFIITYLLYGRHPLIVKARHSGGCVRLPGSGLQVCVWRFAAVALERCWPAENPYELVGEDLRQSGLNMIQELCFVNAYLEYWRQVSGVWRKIFE